MTALLDTNVLIRHLTGDPPEQAARATATLTGDAHLILTDVAFAECIFVLESNYRCSRVEVAHRMRGALGLHTIYVDDRERLFRALTVYVEHRLDFVDAYLIACAEPIGFASVLSFDRALDRVGTVARFEPGAPAAW